MMVSSDHMFKTALLVMSPLVTQTLLRHVIQSTVHKHFKFNLNDLEVILY